MDWQHVGSYVIGQCTDFVESTLSWVPNNLGNAADWLSNAQSRGLQTGSTAHPGDVVVYGAGGGYSQYGHVGVVQAVQDSAHFTVAEGNFKGPGIADTRVSGYGDVLGFIRPPAGLSAAQQGRGSSGGILSGIGETLGSGLHDTTSNATNALSQSTGLEAIGNFFKLIGSKDFWYRGGFIIAGIIIVLIGIAAVSKMDVSDLPKKLPPVPVE